MRILTTDIKARIHESSGTLTIPRAVENIYVSGEGGLWCEHL